MLVSKRFLRPAAALIAAMILASCGDPVTSPPPGALESAGLVGAWRDSKSRTRFVIGSDSSGHNETCRGSWSVAGKTLTLSYDESLDASSGNWSATTPDICRWDFRIIGGKLHIAEPFVRQGTGSGLVGDFVRIAWYDDSFDRQVVSIAANGHATFTVFAKQAYDKASGVGTWSATGVVAATMDITAPGSATSLASTGEGTIEDFVVTNSTLPSLIADGAHSLVWLTADEFGIDAEGWTLGPDGSDLSAAIGAIAPLGASFAVGSAVGQVPQAAVDAFDAAIGTAGAAAGSATATPAELIAARAALEAAAELFLKSVTPAYLYASSAGVEASFGKVDLDDYGSGTTVNLSVTSDPIYNPCIQLNSTTSNLWNGGPACVLNIRLGAGASTTAYKSLTFKIRTIDYSTCAFIVNDDKSLTASALPLAFAKYATPLSAPWYQVRIPLADIAAMPATLTDLFIAFGPDPAASDYIGKVRITDLGLSAAGSF
jgi:hypothetical protein